MICFIHLFFLFPIFFFFVDIVGRKIVMSFGTIVYLSALVLSWLLKQDQSALYFAYVAG